MAFRDVTKEVTDRAAVQRRGEEGESRGREEMKEGVDQASPAAHRYILRGLRRGKHPRDVRRGKHPRRDNDVHERHATKVKGGYDGRASRKARCGWCVGWNRGVC